MKLISIGYIAGTHGLDGTVRVKPKTEYPEVFDYLEYLMLADGDKVVKSLKIEEMSEHVSVFLMNLEGIDHVDKAKKLKGLTVMVPEDILPEEDEDEVYWFKIEGSVVVDEDSRPVGRLIDYMETGGADVFVIESDKGRFLISNNEVHVTKIDAENKTIHILKEGLVSEEV